jgi:O-antigen/teichoic acid export membrane protein
MNAGATAAAPGGGLRAAPLLGASQLLVLAAYALGSVALARMLSPEQLGTFAVFAFFLTALTACGDLGMAASLVRRQDEPSEREFAVAFTTQQVVALALLTAFWAAAPGVVGWYELEAHDVWRLRLVALSLLPISFQSIPVVRLERCLAFQRVAVIDLVPALVFNGLLVVLVWRGLGTLAFAIAAIGRFASAALVAHWLHPWRPHWHWDRALAWRSLRFGIPYQGIHFVSVIKSSVSPLCLGLALGTAALGSVEWAAMAAAFPTVALHALQRLYLPVFARLQHDPPALQQALERMLGLAHAAVAPLAVLLFVLIDPVTRLVFSERWLPAIPLFQVLWLANLLLPSAAPVLGVLHALGHARLALRFTLAMAVGLWLLALPLILLLGTMGFALAQALVQLLHLALLRRARSLIPFRLLGPAAPAWIAAGIAGVWVSWQNQAPEIARLTDLCVPALSGLMVYAGAMAVLRAPHLAVSRFRRGAVRA